MHPASDRLHIVWGRADFGVRAFTLGGMSGRVLLSPLGRAFPSSRPPMAFPVDRTA